MNDNCLDCDERKLGCHDSCSIYAMMKERQQGINKTRSRYMDGLNYDGCLAPKKGRKKSYDHARCRY